MRGRIIRSGRRLISFLSGLTAVILLMCGLLSLLCTLRVGARAFSSHDLIRYRPETEEAKPGLDEITEINPDSAAWLTIFDTNIDYPVLQGRSDMEYINKDAYGNHSISGSVFLSVMNKKDFSEPYQIIYGHNMENGSMFGDIDEFTDEKFFFSDNGKSRGILITPDEVFDLYILAILKTDAYDPVVYKADKTEGELTELLSYIEEKALFSEGTDDACHVIALSTCDGGTFSGRNVLFCKAVKRTETYETVKSESKVKRSHKKERVKAPEKEGSLAYVDIVLLGAALYLAFPLHKPGMLFKKSSAPDIIILMSAALSLAVFIITEDLRGPLEVTGTGTPLMVLTAAVSWHMRDYQYKKGLLISN